MGAQAPNPQGLHERRRALGEVERYRGSSSGSGDYRPQSWHHRFDMYAGHPSVQVGRVRLTKCLSTRGCGSKGLAARSARTPRAADRNLRMIACSRKCRRRRPSGYVGTQAKTRDPMTGPHLWAGVDVGREHHWICVLDTSRTVVPSRRVDNDEAAITAVITETQTRRCPRRACASPPLSDSKSRYIRLQRLHHSGEVFAGVDSAPAAGPRPASSPVRCRQRPIGRRAGSARTLTDRIWRRTGPTSRCGRGPHAGRDGRR